MMHHRPLLAVLVICAIAISGCTTAIPFRYRDSQVPARTVPYPDAGFTVISDIHLCEYPGEEQIIKNSPVRFTKLLAESGELLRAAITSILAAEGDIVLVPGDLTEFGEYDNHVRVAEYLGRLRKAGKQVFVVPGNHDVLNFNAKDAPSARPQRPVTSEEFADIYKDCGYGQAVARDPDSLSYTAEPVPGLLILALDSCRYREQSEAVPSITGGGFSARTLAWMEGQLIQAAGANKAVVAIMHHNLLEHFSTQKKYFPDYVVADNEEIAALFFHYSVRLAFTGHYHAQDITVFRNANKAFLFDIETGSLASYPCPIRFARLDTASQKLFLSSTLVTAIPSHPSGFQEYCRQALAAALGEHTGYRLSRFGFSAAENDIIVPQAIEGYLAHAAGNERPPAVLWRLDGINCVHGCLLNLFATDLAASVWKDLVPPDDDVALDLLTGEWTGGAAR